MIQNLSQIIEKSFENRAEIHFSTKGETCDATNQTLALLDSGALRICEKKPDG